MNITIGTIALNEAEFIIPNLTQHYSWQDANVHQIIIIEGAVAEYPERNTTEDGLSTDGTGDLVREFMEKNDPEKKIHFIQGKWKDKQEQRNQYICLVKDNTDVLIVIDCDEFYTKKSQATIVEYIEMYSKKYSFEVPLVNLWHRPNLVIRGDYWDVPHLKIYRWRKGSRYADNHVQLKWHNENYHIRGRQYVRIPTAQMIHYGFCRDIKNIKDKCRYYLNRGEATTRPFNVKARANYFEWKEGMIAMPNGSRIEPYNGELPECFK